MFDSKRILVVCLSISVLLNLVLAFFLIKNSTQLNSYEGTWKCSNNIVYDITIFVDHNGTFYESFALDDRPYIVYKGYIEKDTLVYKGARMIEENDHFEYLSDIPDEMYEEANYFYKITRNSKSTLLIEIPGDTKTQYTFVKTE